MPAGALRPLSNVHKGVVLLVAVGYDSGSTAFAGVPTMLSATIGRVVLAARKTQGMSRAVLAAQVGVSTRLVGEFERGERPNVSLETTLQLLTAVGVAFELVASERVTSAITGVGHDEAARAARAARRRATWTGSRAPLHAQHDPPAPADAVARLTAVAEVSRRAYAVASAPLVVVPTAAPAVRRRTP